MAEVTRPRGPHGEHRLYDDGEREFMYVTHDSGWIIQRCLLSVLAIGGLAIIMIAVFS